MASITTWARLVPVSRSSDLESSVSAEIRDPLWLLAVQRRSGELTGEDTGSPAFVRIGTRSTALNDLILTPSTGAPTTVALDPTKPIEAQILLEPHGADAATQVELSLMLFRLIEETFTANDDATNIKNAFIAADPLAPAPDTDFDPIDEGTAAFTQVTTGRTCNGVKAYQDAKLGSVPTQVQQALPTGQTLTAVYTAFVSWVEDVFGVVGTDQDPPGWNAQHLDYDVKMRFGAGNEVTLAVHPNENGTVDWSSFDVVATTGDAFPATLPIAVTRDIPTHVRFTGMPAPRYWYFEDGELPLPDLDVAKTELIRLLIVDFAMLYGVDWFVMPIDLDVATAAKVDSLLVFDVFGVTTVVDPVEAGRNPPAPAKPDRFTMFTATGPDDTVGNFVVLPPIAGRALQHGPTLEEVRFARDEMANMAWGIEAVTASRIGERRRGTERDAAVDATIPPATPPPTTAPLRYQIESKVPVHWIPFLIPTVTGNAATAELEKEATVHLKRNGQPAAVPAAGKVLNPRAADSPYQVFDEEISRRGVRVERLVYMSRSRDGKAFLWTARRKRAGSGETQSGLRFDSALPTKT
jgi:hypothetical protein